MHDNERYNYWQNKEPETQEEIEGKKQAINDFNKEKETHNLRNRVYVMGFISFCFFLILLIFIYPYLKNSIIKKGSSTHYKKIIKENNRPIKISAIIVVIILILGIFSINNNNYLEGKYSELKNEKQRLKSDLNTTQSQLINKNSELNSTKKELEQTTKYLQENNSKLQTLKSGDKYELHDPLYNEVTDFIEKDDSKHEKKLIENAKNQGLRCAYVAVNIVGSIIKLGWEPSSDAMYPLVAFETIDRGMVYFEPITDYRVFPKINESYVDCVEGSPYSSDYMTDDTITDIIVIW